MFDLGARQMDPAIGRFMVIDPMADFVNYQSPYAVADNNPIQNVDVYGLGIWNWIKALVSKAANGVKKLFSGNNCDCSGNGESLAQAFRRPDNIFPKRKKNRSKKRNRNKKKEGGESNENSPRAKRPEVSGLVYFGSGVTPLGNEIPSVGNITVRPPTAPPRPPKVKNVAILFKTQSDEIIDNDSNSKFLNDILKTLTDWPQLKVHISGNSAYEPTTPNTGQNLNTPSTLNGSPSTVGNVQLSRARAIEKFLIDRGGFMEKNYSRNRSN